MKIGIDLDNTITASKESIEFFSVLTNLLIAEHRIYIITAREPNSEQDIAGELDLYGIEYSEIVITDNKAEYIRGEGKGISIFFEDCDEFLLEVPSSVVVFKIRESMNFDFAEKKWLANKKTTKMLD